MNTDMLIAALAREVEPAGRRPTWLRLGGPGLAGALIAALAALLFYGVRPDLDGSLDTVLLRNAFGVAMLAATAPLAYVLAQPNTGVGRWVLPALAAAGLSLAFAMIALLATAPGDRFTAWFANEIPICLARIPALALPTMLALMCATRGLAPTRLTLAGSALGALAGAVASLPYAWVCVVDSPPYVATWYPVSILVCAALGALLGHWLLRW